jgi:hypothetical protein
VNEKSRPGKRRLPNNDTGKPNSRCGGQRAWTREVNRLGDEELMRVVRAQVAVDVAVNTYRRAA